MALPEIFVLGLDLSLQSGSYLVFFVGRTLLHSFTQLFICDISEKLYFCKKIINSNSNSNSNSELVNFISRVVALLRLSIQKKMNDIDSSSPLHRPARACTTTAPPNLTPWRKFCVCAPGSRHFRASQME